MNTIPQPAPLSLHAWCMTVAFDILNDENNKEILGLDNESWTPEMQEVLAALDAFADEQTPAPRETEEAE